MKIFIIEFYRNGLFLQWIAELLNVLMEIGMKIREINQIKIDNYDLKVTSLECVLR